MMSDPDNSEDRELQRRLAELRSVPPPHLRGQLRREAERRSMIALTRSQSIRLAQACGLLGSALIAAAVAGLAGIGPLG